MTTIHYNYKKLRLCNKTDFQKVDYHWKLWEEEENNLIIA